MIGIWKALLVIFLAALYVALGIFFEEFEIITSNAGFALYGFAYAAVLFRLIGE